MQPYEHPSFEPTNQWIGVRESNARQRRLRRSTTALACAYDDSKIDIGGGGEMKMDAPL
jgi:hypothetical protein